jgi:hypothetical protein
MQQTVELEKKLTANQLYKIYKDEGGTKTFSEWLTREKTKGVFPLNGEVNEEVQKSIKVIKQNDMNKTVLGFPVRTLAIVGVVILGAIIVSSYINKKK